jgi:hypothetical protein
MLVYNIYKASVSPGSVQQIMLYYQLLLLRQQFCFYFCLSPRISPRHGPHENTIFYC